MKIDEAYTILKYQERFPTKSDWLRLNEAIKTVVLYLSEHSNEIEHPYIPSQEFIRQRLSSVPNKEPVTCVRVKPLDAWETGGVHYATRFEIVDDTTIEVPGFNDEFEITIKK